jgi:methylglutaconyl-CoA hydratase
MNMSSDLIRERRDEGIWITINRPEKRNAINKNVISGIAAAYHEAEADAAIRYIVLTGAGEKAFCAGADLAPGQNFSFDLAQPTTQYADLLRLARRCSIPSIARVNGACVAGGMGLLCIADLVVAVDHAMFGLPEVRLGLFPSQVAALLKDIVSARFLYEWCLLGESFDAATALHAGLVNRVVARAELDGEVQRLVARLAGNSPTAVRRGKYNLRSIAAMSFEEALAFGESQLPLAAMTEDAREGLAAFNEKRKPLWTGR